MININSQPINCVGFPFVAIIGEWNGLFLP